MLPKDILLDISGRIHMILPSAKVNLFGSRARGTHWQESDWDILILTEQPVTTSIKSEIHTKLFPLSVQIGAFINTLTISENEWLNNPSYYSLHKTSDKDMIPV